MPLSPTPPNGARNGLLAAGNFIVDQVKRIDHWPAQDTLAHILGETRSNGGGPYNVLRDLAALGAPFPLHAAGRVGADANGRWIRADCAAHGIDASGLAEDPEAPTSFTDVMSVAGDGRRTFFHHRGANAHLRADQVRVKGSAARWFYLGYLGLLDALDAVRADGSTGAADLLAAARLAGLRTCVDMVSAPQPRFRDLTLAAGPHCDVLFVNEIEAGFALEQDLRSADLERLAAAAAALRAACGCGSVVLHCARGAVVEGEGPSAGIRALHLPEGFIQGAAGAGDAFAAGYLFGLHEGWPVRDRLRLAVGSAAACLSDPTCSGGLRPWADCLALVENYGAG
jgi:sugar/nucleoside kinase (ribokinase family)